MKLRAIEKKDTEKIADIHAIYNTDAEFPSLKNIFTASVAVDDNDEVVALGVVEYLLEAILVLDKSRPLRQKGAALKILMTTAIERGRVAGLSSIFVHSDDDDYCELLKKHFGFIDGGRSLILNLEARDGQKEKE